MNLKSASHIFLLFICLATEVRVTQSACSATGHECDGIPNAYCDVVTSSCRCNPHHSVTKDGGRCLANNGQPCEQDAQCINELCADHDGTKKCSTKVGASCTANGNECVSILNSLCHPTILKCICKGNYTATSNLLQCKLNSGQPCTEDRECISKLCTEDGGIMKCSGTVRGIPVSVVLLLASFMTSRYL